MALRTTRAIATYLRSGTLWVGRFTVEHGELDFGDDRGGAAHALGQYVRVEPPEPKAAIAHADEAPRKSEAIVENAWAPPPQIRWAA